MLIPHPREQGPFPVREEAAEGPDKGAPALLCNLRKAIKEEDKIRAINIPKGKILLPSFSEDTVF